MFSSDVPYGSDMRELFAGLLPMRLMCFDVLLATVLPSSFVVWWTVMLFPLLDAIASDGELAGVRFKIMSPTLCTVATVPVAVNIAVALTPDVKVIEDVATVRVTHHALIGRALDRI